MRVELLFKGFKGSPEQTAVAWTDGRGVFVLRSRSRRHVLDFEQEQDHPNIRFRWLSGGKLEHEGVTVEVKNYKEQNDVLLREIIQEYRSSSGSDEEMQKMIKTAASLVERGPKLDRNGRRVGERVVLIMGPASGGPGPAAVVWTQGAKLYILRSSSLPHVFAFEKQFYQ